MVRYDNIFNRYNEKGYLFVMGEITWLIRHVVNRIYLLVLLFLCGFFFVFLQSEASMSRALNGGFVWIWLILSLILSQIEAKFDIEPVIYEPEVSRYKKQLAIYRKAKKRKVVAVLIGIEWFFLAVNLLTVAYLDGNFMMDKVIPGTDTWITFMTRIRYFGLYAFGIAVIAMLFQYYMTLIVDTIESIFYTKRARYSQKFSELLAAELFHCFHWIMMMLTVTTISGFYGFLPYNDKVDAFVKAHFGIKAVIIMIALTRVITVFICNCRDNPKTHKVLSLALIPELFVSTTFLSLSVCYSEGYMMNRKTWFILFGFAFVVTFLFGILPEIRYRKHTSI